MTSLKEKITLFRVKKLLEQIKKERELYRAETHENILKKITELKSEAKEENLDSLLPTAFGLCCVAAERILNMAPYDVQLIGGIILHNGKIAEMKTGEGKTLVAIFPVFLNALLGNGVHVITVNDYLAKRDAEQMGQVYSYLGMTTGCIYSGMSQEARKEAYACDITYGTNSEFGFDYLRDNMAVTKESLVQRELSYAIIDEVDSILIDESRTPLIISGSGQEAENVFANADSFVKTLKATTNHNPDKTKFDKALEKEEEPNGDYILTEKTKDIILTDSGIEKAEKFFGVENYSDPQNILLTHYISQALRAVYLMKKDVDYLVKDGKIVIIDTSTGRLMESRKYSDNLHQAIEAKEGLEISSESKTMATITYQNFFRLYHKISGMTGTAATDRYELKNIYHLDVVCVPTNRPCVRKDYPDRLFLTKNEKYAEIVSCVKKYHCVGRPVLIGTTSVEESETMHKLLLQHEVPHTVLNAKNHEKEAEIIAQAGRLNAVTIATNMAGRGTDILLGGNPHFFIKQHLNNTAEEISDKEKELIEKEIREECIKNRVDVIASGGLAVIGTERNDNRRIDDQLKGRSGRQGDDGSSEFYISTEDKLFRMFGNMFKKENLNFEYTEKINTSFIKKAQQELENISFSARKNLLEYDDVNDSQRRQIYAMRRQVLMADETKLMNIFDSFQSEAIDTILKSKTMKEDLQSFLRTKDVPDNKVGIEKIINSRNEVNGEALVSIGRTLPSMVRFILLSTIDRNYVQYINQIASLKESVNITVMGSLKPIQLYQMQSIQLFNKLVEKIKMETVYGVANIVVKKPQEERKVISINLD